MDVAIEVDQPALGFGPFGPRGTIGQNIDHPPGIDEPPGMAERDAITGEVYILPLGESFVVLLDLGLKKGRSLEVAFDFDLGLA